MQSSTPKFRSLIDVGALITGMTNRQVAETLLRLGLRDLDGCVYLDEDDQRMVVVRGRGGRGIEPKPVPLHLCGVRSDRRFSFFDQVHTTGTDIYHGPDTVAAVTLFKDSTLRDYAQGCWRMRDLGSGHSVHVLVSVWWRFVCILCL